MKGPGSNQKNGTEEIKKPGELSCFGKVSSSCTTSGTSRVSCPYDGT